MAATPQDFSIWSRLTGNPYPRTPEERMYLAPHVRNFVENIGRQGGYPVQQESGIKRAVKAVGKTALAAGLLVGGAMAAHHYLKDDGGGGGGGDSGGGGHSVADNLENIHSTAVDVLGEKPLAHPFEEHGSSMRRSGTIMTKLPLLQPAQGPEAAESDIQVGTPFETPVQRAEGQDELIGYTPAAHVEAFRRSPQYARMKEENPSLRDIESPSEPASMPQAVRASMDVTPPTTAQRFGQGNINPEIQVRQVAKGAAPGTEARESLRTKPVTESEKLVTSQSFAPATTRSPSNEEIRELDSTLLWSHGHMNREQREAVRNQLLSEKYKTQPETEYVGTGQIIQPAVRSTPAKDFAQSYGKTLMSKTFSPEESSAISHINASQPGVLSVHYHANPEKAYEYKVASPLQMEIGESLAHGEDLGSLGKLVHTSRKLGLLR